jgi:hypothetical protein
VTKLLRILEIFGDSPEAYKIASNLETLTRKGLSTDILLKLLHNEAEIPPWQDRLPPKAIEILNSVKDVTEFRLPPTSRESVFTVLIQLMEDSDMLVRTASLYALKQIDLPKATAEAQHILSDRHPDALLPDAFLPDTLLSEEAKTVVTIRESGSKNRSSNISNNISNVNLTNALASMGNNSGANQVLETFEKLLLLFRNSLFRPLKTDTLAELARHAEIRVYNSGEEIYKSGDLPRAILALVNGSAEICAFGGDRRQLVQKITKIAPNQTLGQLEVLTQTCFTNSAIATSPQTLILAINAELFMQAMREDALYTQHLLISVSSSLQSVLSQMITNSCYAED